MVDFLLVLRSHFGSELLGELETDYWGMSCPIQMPELPRIGERLWLASDVTVIVRDVHHILFRKCHEIHCDTHWSTAAEIYRRTSEFWTLRITDQENLHRFLEEVKKLQN